MAGKHRKDAAEAVAEKPASGYVIKEQVLRDRGRIGHQDVVKSMRMVTPSGAVLSAGLFWIEVELGNGRRLFPVALAEFHQYVTLPVVPLWVP